jgi:hypothetical protein
MHDFGVRPAPFGNNDDADVAETAGSGFALTLALPSSRDFLSGSYRPIRVIAVQERVLHPQREPGGCDGLFWQ